jgi:hypothetical protein
VLLRQELDLGGDLLGLVLGVAAFPDADALAVGWSLHSVFGCSCGLLAISALAARSTRLAAAVVLLQLDDLQRRVVACQLQQVLRDWRRARRRCSGRRRPRR